MISTSPINSVKLENFNTQSYTHTDIKEAAEPGNYDYDWRVQPIHVYPSEPDENLKVTGFQARLPPVHIVGRSSPQLNRLR